MPKKYTHQYGREADWQGSLDESLREAYLQMLDQERHTVVHNIRKGEVDGSIQYMLGKQILSDLPGGDTLPSAEAFERMPTEAKARTMQRLLTDLSDRLPILEPPPDDGNGQGEGNGGGGSGGQGQSNSSQNGNGQPQQPKPQPQGQRPPPAPAKPPEKQPDKGNGAGQPNQDKGKAPPPQPAAAASAGTPASAPPQAAASDAPQVEAERVTHPEENVQGQGGWSTGLKDDSGVDYEDHIAEESVKAHSGGGEQILAKDHKAAPMFYAMRDVWNKLAIDVDFSHRFSDGSERWSLPRVFKSHYNVNYLRHAKEDYGVTVEDIYFSLDTSGSVSAMARQIAAMAAASAGVVHLFHGTEGRPEYKVRTREPLKYPGQAFPEWDDRKTQSLKFSNHGRTLSPEFVAFQKRFIAKWQPLYSRVHENFGYGGTCFEQDVAWMLETERPPVNSLLVFWGDTQGLGLYNPDLLRAIVRPYRFVWMYCYTWDWVRDHYDRHIRNYYAGSGIDDVEAVRRALADGQNFEMAECLKLQMAGFPVVTNVHDGESLRLAMRQLEALKKVGR